jgi:hypothetical protein
VRLVLLLAVLVALGFAGCDSHDSTLEGNAVQQAFSSAGLPLVDVGLSDENEGALRKAYYSPDLKVNKDRDIYVLLFRSDSEAHRYRKPPPVITDKPWKPRQVRNVLVFVPPSLEAARRKSLNKAIASLESQ